MIWLGIYMMGAAVVGLWTWEWVSPFAESTHREDVGVMLGWVVFCVGWPVTVLIGFLVACMRRGR